MAAIKGNRVVNPDGTVTVTWAAVATTDTGAAQDVSDCYERTIHVVGAGNAQLAGSNDGTNFVAIGAALAANTLTQMAVNPKFVSFPTIAAATVTIILHAKMQR